MISIALLCPITEQHISCLKAFVQENVNHIADGENKHVPHTT